MLARRDNVEYARAELAISKLEAEQFTWTILKGCRNTRRKRMTFTVSPEYHVTDYDVFNGLAGEVSHAHNSTLP